MMYRKPEFLDEIPKMPDFLVALRPHTVWEKTPIKLFCTVQGNPRPIVKWSEYSHLTGLTFTLDFFLRVYCSCVTLQKVQNWPFDLFKVCWHSFKPVFTVVSSNSANFCCYLTLNWWKDHQSGTCALTHVDLKREHMTECWLVAGIKEECQSIHSALQGSTRLKTSMESTVWLLAGTAQTQSCRVKNKVLFASLNSLISWKIVPFKVANRVSNKCVFVFDAVLPQSENEVVIL